MLNLKEEAGEQFRNAFRGNLYAEHSTFGHSPSAAEYSF